MGIRMRSGGIRARIAAMHKAIYDTGFIRLRPLYKERVWGGRMMETLFGRQLPPGMPVGESWEVVDRPDDVSVVESGPLAGRSLHDLWTDYRGEVFGERAPDAERFPLLVKILDAREKLSIQVHPPAAVAEELGGEPKTEMWYIVDAEPGAVLYAGLRRGVTREEFEKALREGTAESAVHGIPVAAGDFLFLPSGRLHAIGAGLVIFEIQQNSDTTYRVYDWNRVGLDGKPRTLHIGEALRSINFDDPEPGIGVPDGDTLVQSPLFRVSRRTIRSAAPWGTEGEFSILAVVSGALEARGMVLRPGDFALVPACLPPREREVRPVDESAIALEVTFGA